MSTIATAIAPAPASVSARRRHKHIIKKIGQDRVIPKNILLKMDIPKVTSYVESLPYILIIIVDIGSSMYNVKNSDIKFPKADFNNISGYKNLFKIFYLKYVIPRLDLPISLKFFLTLIM